ncbi:glycerol dehydrogenase [Oceanobacillus iheyensis HTE831]|uniref:Glycerol dehydrogenase n=2 Tax=Oceanobacillus iheyensis TaxID=182710 RepID=Q8ELA3_OCEIH|nr:glycerol dehydrogenase [Oceanobacillus iheyensis HTE831]
MSTSIVKGAPGHYRIGADVLEEIPVLLEELSVNRIQVIAGKRSWQAAKPYLPFVLVKQVEANIIFIDGHTTLEKADKIADQLHQHAIDAVIGIGGGTALDITKAAAAKAEVKSVLIPTIAATCAAWTPLSVFYDSNGAFTHYTYFPLATTLVLVEPAIIAHAPIEYLRAGIGDTLAKFYEADALIESFYPNEEVPVPVKVSQFSASICRDVLLEDGKAALDAVRDKQVTPALIRVIEAIIITGGMVGGFGDKAGRIAGAHSLHNGLTEASEAQHFLHGELVAYGILGQLAFEQKEEELLRLLDFYDQWQLPSSLQEIGIDITNTDLVERIIQKAILPQESIHFMNREVTAESLASALQQVEKNNQIYYKEKRGEKTS